MTRLVNVATPATAVAVVVPESVPLPEAFETVTTAVDVVMVLPPESVTLTTGWVVKADPLTAPAGWVVIAAALAAPAVTLSELEVMGVNEVGVKVRVKAPAVPVMTRLVTVSYTHLTLPTIYSV